MALRTVCEYEGRLIGIESIYTVVDGMQINIPEKVSELRKLGRENKLFCPCGCGANLILVAGDRNLREQHFRIRGEEKKNCHVVAEGENSIYSKVVLKCWMEDKLHSENIESRVPIKKLDDTDRKYEFTFLDRKRRIALSYYNSRANITDEKLEILDSNAAYVRVVYICDIENKGSNGQFPEMMHKIQERQGYCLYLKQTEMDYFRSSMCAAVYVKNWQGIWDEIDIADGPVTDFDIHQDGSVCYNGRSLEELAEEKAKEYAAESEAERARIAKKREETATRDRRMQELIKSLEKRPAHRREVISEEEKRRTGLEDVKPQIEHRVAKAMDRYNVRWAQCTACGEIKPGTEFHVYGKNDEEGSLGYCRECFEKGIPEYSLIPKPQEVCPWCGGDLVERNGRFGLFLACSNYPDCRFTKSIK